MKFAGAPKAAPPPTASEAFVDKVAELVIEECKDFRETNKYDDPDHKGKSIRPLPNKQFVAASVRYHLNNTGGVQEALVASITEAADITTA